MKFDEPESIEDSPQEVIVEEENETKPMLDYDNIKSSQDIEVPPLLIDQVIGHEESIETIKDRGAVRGAQYGAEYFLPDGFSCLRSAQKTRPPGGARGPLPWL